MASFIRNTLFCFCLLTGTILVFYYLNRTKANVSDKLQELPESGILHVITNYPVMFEKPWNEKQSDTSKTRLRERQEEIEETLQRNLNHPLVLTVHLLINQIQAEQRLRELNFQNKHKILVHRISSLPKYRDFLDYANEKLQNQVVVMMNMDIYLGEGFENLNKTFLVKKAVSYVLTRSGRQEKRCNMAGGYGYCETNRYIGSHDAYVFVLTRPLDESVLSELNYQMNVMGAENVFLWVLKTRMKMKLLNPCRYLKTYHNHCVNIHGSVRPRINLNGKSGKAAPSGLYD